MQKFPRLVTIKFQTIVADFQKQKVARKFALTDGSCNSYARLKPCC
jgi:hypothetical protein